MVLRGGPPKPPVDHFYEAFVAGMEVAAGPRGAAVLTQVVPNVDAERLTYQRWHDQRLVAGVVLSDLVEDDDRAALLHRLGIPIVVLGEYLEGPQTVCIDVDNIAAMEQALRYLTSLGHRRIARVSGPTALLHTRDRSLAFAVSVTALGFSGLEVEGDYTAESGAAATETLLGRPDPPTAIVYDNDQMAVGGLATAHRLGIDVPRRLSLLAWDDTAVCRLARPPLSVLARDIRELGELAVRSLLDLLDGQSTVARQPAPPAVIVIRATTGPSPRSTSTG